MSIIMFYFCDEWKTLGSLRLPEGVFADTQSGREKLIAFLMETGDAIEISNEADFFELIRQGEIGKANELLTYGFLETETVIE